MYKVLFSDDDSVLFDNHPSTLNIFSNNYESGIVVVDTTAAYLFCFVEPGAI